MRPAAIWRPIDPPSSPSPAVSLDENSTEQPMRTPSFLSKSDFGFVDGPGELWPEIPRRSSIPVVVMRSVSVPPSRPPVLQQKCGRNSGRRSRSWQQTNKTPGRAPRNPPRGAVEFPKNGFLRSWRPGARSATGSRPIHPPRLRCKGRPKRTRSIRRRSACRFGVSRMEDVLRMPANEPCVIRGVPACVNRRASCLSKA